MEQFCFKKMSNIHLVKSSVNDEIADQLQKLNQSNVELNSDNIKAKINENKSINHTSLLQIKSDFLHENKDKNKEKKLADIKNNHQSIDDCLQSPLEIWNSIQNFLYNEYGHNLYQNCFSFLKFIKISDQSIVISAPNKTIRSLILQTYFHKIHNFITSNYQNISVIEILIEQNNYGVNNAQTNLIEVHDFDQTKDQIKVNSTSRNKSKTLYINKNSDEQLSIGSILDQNLSFENFVHDVSNRIAYNAAKELVSNSSAIAINSLCIHGDIGMGKTHLLQSIANHLAPSMRVAYFTSEKFSREYVNAVQNNSLNFFKNYLSELDVLLLDDLQFLCGKHSTERELTNTFDGLMALSKKVVLSSNIHPSQLQLDPRSKSRFTSCLSVGIHKSNFDLRIKILEHKLIHNEFAKKIGLNREMLYLIAYHVCDSIRELEASFNRIIKYCQLAEINANPEIIHHLVVSKHEDRKAKGNNTVSAKIISTVVSDYFSIDQVEMISRSRIAKISHARQIAAYLMRELAGMSVKQIGIFLGNRDHSTIVYMINSIRNQSSSLRMHQLDEIRNHCVGKA